MDTGELQWRPAIPGKLISENEVHVWRACLNVSALQYENMFGFVSADELERAGRLRFERDQKRFIVARGILRKILGSYLEKTPDKLHFEYTAHGKPELASNVGNDTLRFNVSHSDAFALYAVSLGQSIGIDIERIRDDVDVDQIAKRFFSPGEIRSLEEVHESKLSKVFFQYWTRKEAFIKATGKGISFPMEQCDVSLLSGRYLSPVTLLNDVRKISSWYVQDLFPDRSYAAAIAVKGDAWNLSLYNYSV